MISKQPRCGRVRRLAMSGQVLAQLLRFTSAVCVLLGSNLLVRDTRAGLQAWRVSVESVEQEPET